MKHLQSLLNVYLSWNILYLLPHVFCLHGTDSTQWADASRDEGRVILLWFFSLCKAPDACRENRWDPAKSNTRETPQTRATHSFRKYCREKGRRERGGAFGPEACLSHLSHFRCSLIWQGETLVHLRFQILGKTTLTVHFSNVAVTWGEYFMECHFQHKYCFTVLTQWN